MKNKAFCLIAMIFVFSACSTGQIKGAIYHALKDKECMDTQGYPDCDEDRPDFNEYEKQRKQITKE